MPTRGNSLSIPLGLVLGDKVAPGRELGESEAGESMKQRIPSPSRGILLSWVIGALIVLLAVIREQGGAPHLARTLLWPGLRLAHQTGHSAHDIGIVLIIVGDSIVYGFFSLLILRALRTSLHFFRGL